jgi:uncharacterized protein with ParB-like and HNH nuclease domain
VKIDSFDSSVSDVLRAAYYRIPRFQRPYSWDRSNVDDFWTDLTENKVGYFIGSMVLYKRSQRAEWRGLVDGQQRMTTISMLLAALRDKLEELGDEARRRGCTP